MDPVLYRDGNVTVTPTEIRAKGFTLFLRNVTSVSTGTIRPGKWAPALLFPVGVTVWFLSAISPFGNLSGPILISMIPLLFLNLGYFCMRVSRLYLQTTGGPVVLAYSVSLREPTEVLQRYERIRRAIEQGISAQKASASV
jgi:hypothetical protein